MKKILFILCFLSAIIVKGQVKVLGYVVPNAISDQYPTHVDTYGQGGLQSVNTLAERNAITTLRRKKGMLVYVADSVKVYQLGNDLTTWTVFNSGGGANGNGNGTGEIDPVFTAHVSSSITQANIDFWNRIALLPFYPTLDSVLSKIDSAGNSRDYTFDPYYFAVNNRYVTFNLENFVENDPEFFAHVASTITQADIDRWNQSLDLTGYITKDSVIILLRDSAYKYYVDGKTIKGDGSLSDPFHVIPFGGDSTFANNNYYNQEQVDSAIAANYREYSAGYGLLLENSQFRLDTTRIRNDGFGGGTGGGGNGGGGNGTVTSVSVVTANGLSGTVATPTTTPAITLFADTTNVFTTHNQLNTRITNIRNDFGDSLSTVRNQFNNTSTYHIPYNGDPTYYWGGDSGFHAMPTFPNPNDSIDYSFSSMKTLYNENGPGERTVNGVGITANPDNLVNPFRQLKSINIGAWTDGDYVSFTGPDDNVTSYTFLRGFFRLKSVVDIPDYISFVFYNNGAPISRVVSVVNYGLDKNKPNVYQNISIQMSAFAFTSTTFDEIRLFFGGSNSSGIYLDLLQFQNATAIENSFLTDSYKKPGTDSVFIVRGGVPQFAYIDGGTGGVTTDTTSLSNRINQKLDIADTSNIRLRPIAGSNITITGTYPNLTINSTGTTTVGQTITATAGQTAFTFTSVPSTSSDFLIFVNGGKWTYSTGYTFSGNVITTTTPLDAGDKISYIRIK